jgi:RimJ/RimL family protein N-acetyltransferase
MSLLDAAVVRARTKDDISEIVSWIPDSHALYLFSGSRLQWPLTESQLQEMERIEGLTPWVVARPTGEAVGHFDLTQIESEARLGRVIIQPTMRGLGLASTLLRLALSKAREQGAESVRLKVISNNEPAVRTYVRAGFFVATDASDRSDVTEMIKKLVPAPDAR